MHYWNEPHHRTTSDRKSWKWIRYPPAMRAFISPAALFQRHCNPLVATTPSGNLHLRRPLHAVRDRRCNSWRMLGREIRMNQSIEVSSIAPSPSTKGLFNNAWDFITILFPVWTLVAAGVSLAQPSLFGGLTSEVIMRRMLSLLMLSTGLTLTGAELAGTANRAWPLLFSFLCCYAVMPGLALLLTKIFRLAGADGAGLLLLGIVSGGQTSNLCTLIAGGDVALSVAMTTLTSVASVVAIPALTAWLLGHAVNVDPLALGRSTIELLVLPLLIGAGLNTLFPGLVKRMKGALPAVGIGAVLALIVGPVSETSQLFFTAAGTLGVPVVLLHILGGLVGFLVPALFRAGRKTCVTTAFESGFKSPVLSFVLARMHFGENVGMASVVSIVVLAPLAALFAVILRIVDRRRESKNEESQVMVPWKGYVGGGDDIGELVRDNKRRAFRVVRYDGRDTVVPYEQLRNELDRARRHGGVRAVERIVMDQ